MKRTNTNAKVNFLDVLTDGGATFSQFYVESGSTYGDKLGFYTIASGTDYGFFTDAVYRDVSSWYHVVFRVDTTDATADNRVRVYVNGTEQAVTNTYGQVPQNYDFHINRTLEHNIGYNPNTGVYSNGYLSEYHFIDGTALAPTSFGETKSGIWIPKKYTGSHGTNGFYLPFDDSSAIGDDESSNTNDFTVSGLAATDVVLDSPTNNYVTLNSIHRSNMTYSEGNLRAVGIAQNYDVALATHMIQIDDGNGWYWEWRTTNHDSATNIGITRQYNTKLHQHDPAARPSSTSDAWAYIGSGNKETNDSQSSYGSAWTTNDILQVAVKDGKIWFGINGVWQNSGDPEAGTNAAYTGLTGDVVPFFCMNGTRHGIANFGQDSSFAGGVTAQGNTDENGQGDFYYEPPAGFKALCTFNIQPDLAIDPAADETPEDYFNTVLYTGTGATQSITGVGFQPDWVWLKRRSSSANHTLLDVVRGATKTLESSTTGAEETQAQSITSFDSDGWTIGSRLQDNQSGGTYVSWNWLAGGTAVSNTDGSITTSVSANTKAGFSILTYTGNNTSGATIGHGLDQAPEFAIIKKRDGVHSWHCYHESLGNTHGIQLSSNGNKIDLLGYWNDTSPTSSVMTLGNYSGVNATDDYVAYCFHSVEGYSKLGQYRANGNDDGVYVYCGFRPNFIMVKATDATEHWNIPVFTVDANGSMKTLSPNRSVAERNMDDNPAVDILSNGFKMKTNDGNYNNSGKTFLFYAVAEQPFKYSNAR